MEAQLPNDAAADSRRKTADYQETDLKENEPEIAEIKIDSPKPSPSFSRENKAGPSTSFSREKNKCPLCEKDFGDDKSELLEHAANCNGVDELTQENCPICDRQYPPEQLPEHAQECAQYMFD